MTEADAINIMDLARSLGLLLRCIDCDAINISRPHSGISALIACRECGQNSSGMKLLFADNQTKRRATPKDAHTPPGVEVEAIEERYSSYDASRATSPEQRTDDIAALAAEVRRLRAGAWQAKES